MLNGRFGLFLLSFLVRLFHDGSTLVPAVGVACVRVIVWPVIDLSSRHWSVSERGTLHPLLSKTVFHLIVAGTRFFFMDFVD